MGSEKPYYHISDIPQDLLQYFEEIDPPSVPAVVLDPFGGAGTVGAVCNELGRDAILCELNPEYVELIEQRCVGLPMFDVCEVSGR